MEALIIDDSRAIRLVLSRMVADLGYTVAEASNGVEALAQLDGGAQPHVMLVDWNMPEMDGLTFVTEVRRRPYPCTAKILMVTTETEVTQVVKALDAGADEYIMKPFTKEAVAEKLQLLGLGT